MAEATDATTPAAAAVAMRAPTFCAQDPTIWFSILECGFTASSITRSLTKFTHGASLLPPDVLSQVSDVITTAVTSTTPYEDLKAAVLKRLQSSVAARFRELLSKEELGGEKPTDLLRRMKQLLGDKYQSFDEDLFKQLFYQRLPPDIQRALISVKSKLPPDELANLADDYMATLPPVQASSVSSITPQDSSAQITQLTSLLSQLLVDVSNIKKQLSDRPRSRSSTPHRRRHQSRSRSASGMCYYHRKFGDNAVKCDKPCTYTTASNTSGGH